MMVWSTFSSNNMHIVVDNNCNFYKSMVMDVMVMKQGYTNECSIVSEEPNVNVARFFELLKDFDEPL